MNINVRASRLDWAVSLDYFSYLCQIIYCNEYKIQCNFLYVFDLFHYTVIFYDMFCLPFLVTAVSSLPDNWVGKGGVVTSPYKLSNSSPQSVTKLMISPHALRTMGIFMYKWNVLYMIIERLYFFRKVSWKIYINNRIIQWEVYAMVKFQAHSTKFTKTPWNQMVN